VELLPDNCEECCERLYEIWNAEYTSIFNEKGNDETREAVRYILQTNIICGDMLKTIKNDGNPIAFTEWTVHNDGNCELRDYLLSDMVEEPSLANHYYNDEGEFVMNIYREYPLVHFKNLKRENEHRKGEV
jgi:hypothetical protein